MQVLKLDDVQAGLTAVVLEADDLQLLNALLLAGSLGGAPIINPRMIEFCSRLGQEVLPVSICATALKVVDMFEGRKQEPAPKEKINTGLRDQLMALKGRKK